MKIIILSLIIVLCALHVIENVHTHIIPLLSEIIGLGMVGIATFIIAIQKHDGSNW